VDDAAGPDVAQKVERRLQHFIDRKIASLFEPLLGLQRDEALTGLARGFAFRMVEAFGILPRAEVAQEVKDLDQEARGALRKHGIRFGQYTIFMPLLLKPAPTRLRLLLWSLANGHDEFPEAPPPGLVTIPNRGDALPGHDTMSGYRGAGERAIRIDMLERLADMLRAEDSRKGFEARADMLSITGMTLEQFADLMQGLGYKAERGEREKARPAPAVPEPAQDSAPIETADTAAAPAQEAPAEEAPAQTTAPEAAEAPADIVEVQAPEVEETPSEPTPDEVKAEEAAAEPETEVFFTFTWGRARTAGQHRNRRPAKQGDAAGATKGGPRGAQKSRPKSQGKPQGRKGGSKPQDKGAQTFTARPPKKDKPIDPDNPFAAALMGLRDDK
jgi:ATP-dependent RNA helicase SUPV3L1/SUV3